MKTFLIIIIGAISWRGANSLMLSYSTKNFLALPIFFTTAHGSKIARMYSYSVIPLSIVNGALINGWWGILIVVIGTWIGMLIANLLLRFNAALQLIVFGFIYIIFTIYNIFRFLM